jgi:hypothetical protein
MTLREIHELADGHQERLDNYMHMLAWHAANVMNIHLKKKITPKKLLGKDRAMSSLDRQNEFTKLKKALEERRTIHGNIHNSQAFDKNWRPI